MKVVKAAKRNNSNAKRWLGVGVGTVAAVGLHLSPQQGGLREPSPAKPTQTAGVAFTNVQSATETNSGDAVSNPPSPEWSTSEYELGFRALCGICAGVFVKKSGQLVAFAVSGIFTWLQFLSAIRVITDNWTEIKDAFEELFYEEPMSLDGKRKAPAVAKLWNRLVHFLVTDFPARATFAVGFALGLEIG